MKFEFLCMIDIIILKWVVTTIFMIFMQFPMVTTNTNKI